MGFCWPSYNNIIFYKQEATTGCCLHHSQILITLTISYLYENLFRTYCRMWHEKGNWHNNEQFQNLEIIEDLGFFSVQDLQDHITQHHHQHLIFAAVLIVPPDKSMVLCFDHTTISLFESHRHGPQGGLIATSSSGNINNFIRYLAGMVMRDWGAQLQGPNMAISFNLSKLLSPFSSH